MIYLNTSCPTIHLYPINISLRLISHFFFYLFGRKLHLTVSFYIEIYIDTVIPQNSATLFALLADKTWL